MSELFGGKKWVVSILIPILLFIASLTIRIPYFTEIPRFRGNELSVTLELVNGESFPLYNQHPHIGALSNYLHAIGFWILGMHYWVPGLLAVLAGSVTVVLLYFLGLRTTGFAAAVIGSILMSFSVFHVFFVSHIPWSNCLTPFFVVLFVLCFTKALQDRSTGWFVFSGFVYGMALQTHPSVVTIFPAALFLFFMQGRETVRWWFRNRLAYLVLPAVALGGLNLLLYNLMSQWDSVRYELSYPKYALERDPGIQTFSSNSFGAWTLILRLLSGAMETRLIAFYWTDPFFLFCLALLAVGLLTTLLSRRLVIPSFFLCPIFLIPLVNRGYELCTLGRYLGFLIPFGTLLCACAVVWCSVGLARAAGRWSGIVVATVLTGMILFAHIDALSRTYATLKREDHSYVFLSTLKMLSKYDKDNTTIIIDPLAHDSPMLLAFLRSDGWDTRPMSGKRVSRKLDMLRLRKNYAGIGEQVRTLQKEYPERKIICLLSPLNLKIFLKEPSVVTFEACLRYDEKERRRNLYYALLANVYYVFGLSSAKDADVAPLEALMRLQPYIPGDLHVGIARPGSSRRIRKIEVPFRIRRNFDVQTKRIATEVPVFPETNSSICMEEKTFLRRKARGEKMD